jgi:hypothetical protein
MIENGKFENDFNYCLFSDILFKLKHLDHSIDIYLETFNVLLVFIADANM